MSPLSQYLYCHKIRHQKDFHFLYVRGFRSVQLRLPLESQGTCVRQLRVFPQDRHVQDLRGLQHRGFDLESFGIGDVGSNQRGFFPGCDLVLFIK